MGEIWKLGLIIVYSHETVSTVFHMETILAPQHMAVFCVKIEFLNHPSL